MHPTWQTAIVYDGVIPQMTLVWVLAGRNRSPRRTTQGTRRISIREPCTARRDTIEVRRLHNRMPVTTQQISIVIIGLKVNEVTRRWQIKRMAHE